MSTAAAIFATNTPLPAAGASLTGGAPDAQGEGVFAGLLDTATAEAPSQAGPGSLKPPHPANTIAKGVDTAAMSLVIDAPVAQVKDHAEAVIVSEVAASDIDDAGSAIETPATELASETNVAPAVWQPTPAPPVAVAPQPTAVKDTHAAQPTNQPSVPQVMPAAANDIVQTPAAEPVTAQPAAFDVTTNAGPAGAPVAATAPETITASTKAAEAAVQAQVKNASTTETEQATAPVAPALKAEGRASRSAAEATPTGMPSPATNDASAPASSTHPAQAKTAANDTSSAKAPAAEPADLTAPDALNDAAPSPDTDNQTATAPAAAREAAQPQATPAALTSTLSRATVETTAQMSAQILRRLEGRSTHFDMVLTPEALGRVEVSVDIDADGQLAARLAFDNPAAALDLRGRADELRRQLEDAGFRLSDDSLSFTDRDSGRSGDQRQDGAARRFASAARVASDADQTAPAARWISMNPTPDRVDVRV